MLTSELLNRVRRLEIRTAKVVDEVIGGAYHSVFKGRGIEFDEVREYTCDDDVRDIDWNVSARLNAPYVKKYIEERELTVMLLLDVSASIAFGRPGQSKRDLAIEVAAMLGMSAIRNHDRVGLSLFSDKVELFLTPRSGRRHGLRLIRELVAGSESCQDCATDIGHALKNACNVLKKRSVIFLISDMIDPSPEVEKALKIANRRHDVVVLKIYDPAEFIPPKAAVNLYDAESSCFVHLGSRAERAAFSANGLQAAADRQVLCRRSGVETIDLECGVDPLAGLIEFFRRRRKAGRNPARKMEA
ncbi:hypothetical protein SDC9_83479 [bioreactor metagenome]|uniref:DUF58 domain-containing protein n=1 Tax=bioreactor metagenome TaxID=1076179 RepID=A0A644Z7N2_9ZZZZ